MIVYHTTYSPLAIIGEGFDESHEQEVGDTAGVLFSTSPLGAQDGVSGDTVLALDIPEEMITRYAWTEEGQPPSFFIPFAVANWHGPPVMVDYDPEHENTEGWLHALQRSQEHGVEAYYGDWVDHSGWESVDEWDAFSREVRRPEGLSEAIEVRLRGSLERARKAKDAGG